MPKAAEPWSLTSLREKLIKIGRRGREPWPLCHVPDGRGRGVSVHVRDILMLIARLRAPPAPA
jgi:hypothetical protein